MEFVTVYFKQFAGSGVRRICLFGHSGSPVQNSTRNPPSAPQIGSWEVGSVAFARAQRRSISFVLIIIVRHCRIPQCSSQPQTRAVVAEIP